MLPSLNKYGYVFEGWYDNEAFNGNSINAIEQGRSGNLDLYAKFTQYTYEIKVDGSAYNLEDLSIDVIYTLDFSIPFEVVEGAQFKGYYFAPNGEGGKVCDSNGNSVHVYDWNESITIYPYYIADSFSITYIYPGGSMEPEPVYYYTVFDDIIVLPTVYYLDYKFLGWYTDSEFTSERIDTIDPKSMQTYTLYAKCEVVYYNCHIAYENIVVTFDLQYDDKKIIQTIDYASGQYTFEYPEHPVREGYIFGGWYKTPECGDNDKIYLTSFPRNNLTIYAKWIEIPEAISSEVYEIVHLDFTDYNSNKPLTYTISENCTADKPTLFFMLLDPAEDYSHVNIKGTSNTNVSIGTFGWDNTYYEGQNFTLTQDYTTVSLYTMKYSILMVYVYGNGSKFDINLYVDGMYEFETIDVCNKLIKHNERLVVLDKYGDYVLEGIYTEPNCQGERISSDWEVFSKYLYEGLVVYPHYVLVEE